MLAAIFAKIESGESRMEDLSRIQETMRRKSARTERTVEELSRDNQTTKDQLSTIHAILKTWSLADHVTKGASHHSSASIADPPHSRL
jgi:hypothetical protein